MTTVIFDGTTLVADSRSTATTRHPNSTCTHCKGSTARIVVEDDSPKIKLWSPKTLFKGSRVLATAGAGTTWVTDSLETLLGMKIPLDQGVRAWGVFTRKRGNEAKENNVGQLLIWTEEGLWFVELSGLIYTEKKITEFPYSLGSGGRAAMLALKRLTKDPRVAVGYASEVDPHSNTHVSYVTAELVKERRVGRGVIEEKRGKPYFKETEPLNLKRD